MSNNRWRRFTVAPRSTHQRFPNVGEAFDYPAHGLTLRRPWEGEVAVSNSIGRAELAPVDKWRRYRRAALCSGRKDLSPILRDMPPGQSMEASLALVEAALRAMHFELQPARRFLRHER